MKPRVLLVAMAALAIAAVGLVPMAASAHESCATDAAGDADPGYDITEFCVSGGDEDPVELSAFVEGAADDLIVQWDAAAFAVVYDVAAGTVGVTGTGAEFVACEGTTGVVADGVLLDVTVPAVCLPQGTHDLTALSFGPGGLQDETPVAVGGVPAAEGQPGPDDGGHGGHGDGSDEGPIRLAGADRISTAIAISQDSYPDGAPAVLLANADNPVDALPASRAAAYEGPILYVPSCGELPAAVAAEIARLAPTDVVVLGGTGAICDAIAMAAHDARDDGAPAERVEGTPDPDAVPADQQDGDVREADFQLLDTRPEEGYEQAGGQAFIARGDDGVTVTIRVEGLLPGVQYVSHVHSGSCADGGGEHFMYDPEGGDTPPNEIHLPFTAGEDGTAVQTSTHTTVPGEDARSIVVHPRDDGPARVMCAEWPAA